MIKVVRVQVEAKILNNYRIQVLKKADVQEIDEYIYEITTTTHGFRAYLML
ncbi:hypothetical protein HYC85_026827 [Camellia sinensis]|uniref:Uncharacterized protein n=1 Tax=Camellia sinensis TaxID=4442 RepID=A0A7J7G8C0_CAMSI|nr:hypothetical protein HYC85_026827 [Camellia sinensis]